MEDAIAFLNTVVSDDNLILALRVFVFLVIIKGILYVVDSL